MMSAKGHHAVSRITITRAAEAVARRTAFSRALARAARSAPRRPESPAIRSITREAVAFEATTPSSSCCSDRAEVGQAVHSVGDHHRQVPNDPTGIVAAVSLTHRRKRPRQRVGRPSRSAASASSATPVCVWTSPGFVVTLI